MTNIEKFEKKSQKIAETYKKKNADYGDSFNISLDKYGPIAALTRISDKFNRLENLILSGKQNVSDESIIDTLEDLASYCIMTVINIEKEKTQ